MLRVRQPLLAVVGTAISATATATGSSTVSAVGSSIVPKPIQGLTFLFGALYDAGGGGAANASATGVSIVSAGFSALATFDAAAVGSSTVSAVGSTGGSVVTADASATGSSTVSAIFSGLATYNATATGSSTVTAALSALATYSATATGSSTVSAVGSSITGATANATATGSSTVSAVLSALGTFDASATGSSTVTAVFSALATYTASATGSSTVTAVGSSTGGAVAADASAIGFSTVEAAGSSLAATNATATGSSTVSAKTGGEVDTPSVEQKFARWASYRRVGSNYLRQVSPGVFLRVRPEERVPQVVVKDKVVGPLDKLSLRGQAIALGLTKSDQRKLRKELRRIELDDKRIVKTCGTVCAGKSKVSARGSSVKMTPEETYVITYYGLTKRELIDILDQLEII